jgi:hypothetical protein
VIVMCSTLLMWVIAADDSEYWQMISQVCNLVILCDGLNIMILFLLLKKMND